MAAVAAWQRVYVCRPACALHSLAFACPSQGLSLGFIAPQEGQDYLAAMACAANYAWVNRSSMTFLVRQAFQKLFKQQADDLDMHVVYDVSHNIAKARRSHPLPVPVTAHARPCCPRCMRSGTCTLFHGPPVPLRLLGMKRVFWHTAVGVSVSRAGHSCEDVSRGCCGSVAHGLDSADPAQVEEHMVDGVAKRLLVHRKGATRAFPPHHPLIPVDYQLTGQPVLIGGTMGTHSYVLTGAYSLERQNRRHVITCVPPRLLLPPLMLGACARSPPFKRTATGLASSIQQGVHGRPDNHVSLIWPQAPRRAWRRRLVARATGRVGPPAATARGGTWTTPRHACNHHLSFATRHLHPHM